LTSLWLISQEARALLTRLNLIKPFVLQETMVPAAAPSHLAQTAIEDYLVYKKSKLREMIQWFLEWLAREEWVITPDEAQRRLSFLRLRFIAVLLQLDVFADVMTQRSEQETGVWLAGLDKAATDLLRLAGDYYKVPPIVCYLDRGIGGAIRRARTRLPGGGRNPVAIIRIPRERMIGTGIASTLGHEVGHQGAVALDLVNSFRPILVGMQKKGGSEHMAWALWARWVPEIIPDFWAISKIGIASTLGLMGVVSLPRAFVFRFNIDSPHPIPWIRVKLSCAMGNALYPHPQWGRLENVWESYYPRVGLNDDMERLFSKLESTLPSFISLLVNHRPKTLRGSSLLEVFSLKDRHPARLAEHYSSWSNSAVRMYTASPSLVFAVVGQARTNGRISPEAESKILSKMFTYWAMKGTLDTSAICALQGGARTGAPVT